MQVLDRRRSEIMEEVLDLLMSFVDFQAFKDLMLAHKMEATSKPMQVGNPNHNMQSTACRLHAGCFRC